MSSMAASRRRAVRVQLSNGGGWAARRAAKRGLQVALGMLGEPLRMVRESLAKPGLQVRWQHIQLASAGIVKSPSERWEGAVIGRARRTSRS